MLKGFLGIALCAVIALAVTPRAQAVLITSSAQLNGPTSVIDFSQFGAQVGVGAGIQVGGLVGEDVFLTAVGDHRVGPMGHGLGANGTWTRSGVLNNDANNGLMTFTFNDGPVIGVGGFVNYAPGFGPGQVLMQVLGAGNVVLETHDLIAEAPISTPGGLNAGAFRGIVRNSADIHALRLSFGFNVIDDLEFSRSGQNEVPEPATATLGLLAFGGLMLRRRRMA